MHWIDVALPATGTCPESDRLLTRAGALLDTLEQLQEQHGIDAPVVTARMAEVGHLLFRAITAGDATAFHPGPDAGGDVAYHVNVTEDLAGLPWHWLHNGMNFLLEQHPVTAGVLSARIPEADPPRPWMQRHSDALFGADEGADERAVPEILFVPGHGREEIRRLMHREADGIDAALDTAGDGGARLRVPGAVTPGLLAARAMLYQALHFAAPTSQPPEVSGAGENRWLASLMAAAGHPDADEVDDLVGADLEIVGVDPVEAALDQAMEAYERRGLRQPVGAGAPATGDGWMLEDGPVCPEQLGQGGCLPPLVFSNSWCSLSWLGQRFLEAGASTFVGTSAAVYSRPARQFAARFYGFLGDGRCVGDAHRRAALALRDQLGAEHPAWLCHGVQGYGCLRLADL